MPDEVVTDTSPIQYLHALDLLHLLPGFYTSLLAPRAVLEELEAGREAGFDLPDLGELSWIQLVEPGPILPRTTSLGRGEAAALSVAVERGAALVLVDDRQARTIASGLGLTVTGTLGIILQAKQERVIEAVSPYLVALRDAGFRLSDELEQQIRLLAAEA